MLLKFGLLKSWHETVQGLAWSELKVTALLMLNSMREAVRQIGSHFFGVPLLFLLMIYAFYGLGALGIIGYMLFIVLLMRPSVGIKDVNYFLNKLNGLVAVVVIFFLIIDAIAVGFYADAPGITRVVGQLIGYEMVFGGGFFVVSPLALIWLFWVFDARYGMQDFFVTLRQALTMFFYHYPFFMLVYLLARYALLPIVWFISSFIESSSTQLLVQTALLILLIIPLYVAAIRYGYIKFMRQNFGRYYYEDV